MKLGRGIAIAGVWFSAALMTIGAARYLEDSVWGWIATLVLGVFCLILAFLATLALGRHDNEVFPSDEMPHQVSDRRTPSMYDERYQWPKVSEKPKKKPWLRLVKKDSEDDKDGKDKT